MFGKIIGVAVCICFSSVQAIAEARIDEALRLEKLTISAIDCALLKDEGQGRRIVDAEGRRLLQALGSGPLQFSDDELNRAIAFLKLNADSQSMISLWSGGPRHLILPFKLGHVIVDLHPIPIILQNLFFRVQHNRGARGILFEEEFRKALSDTGHSVKSGKLYSINDEHRELDAGVTAGNKLVLFECVSVARRLDYEIGNPVTIKERCDRLDTKIDQVLSLIEFVKRCPKGRNYSFDPITKIEGYVVSPFHEWIWDTTDRYWVNGRPRILSASEALELLNVTKNYDNAFTS